MSRIFCFCPVLICALFSWTSAAFFEQSRLTTDGTIVNALVEDITGDGLLDIIAVYTTGLHPDTERWIAVFRQNGGRIFQQSPDQVWKVDTRAAVMDVGDVSPAPGLEIVFMAGDGIYFYQQYEDGFQTMAQKLIERETIFAQAEEDDLPAWDFATNIGSEPGDEVLVVSFGEIDLWSRSESAEYRHKQSFPVNMTMHAFTETPGEQLQYSMRADYRIPRIELKDVNRDGHFDVVVSWEDNMDVFLQGTDGTFPSRPDQEFRLNLCSEDERRNRDVELLLAVEDLNGDGLMDVVANKMKGGLANATTQTRFYTGQSDGSLEKAPARVLTAKDAVSEPLLVDLNGDGLPDLIQPEVKMGITSVVSMLLMKRFDINFLVSLNRGQDLFSEDPDFSTKIGFKIDFSRHGGTISPLIEFEGDYNGDGRKDLAVGTKEDELSIFFGDSHKVFTKNPQVQETVKTFSSVVAKDFDRDGKTELMLFYPEETDDSSHHIILFWPK